MTVDHSRETLQRVLEAAGVVFRRNACRCPFHDDKRASAGIYERGDAWRFKCQVCGAGGDVEDVRKLLGQTPAVAHNGNGKADPPLPKTARSWPTLDGAVTAALASVARGFPGAVEAGRWIYRDESGADVAAVVRFDLPPADGGKQDKTFRPVHRVSGGWAMGDPPGKWPVYRLPELLAAKRAGAGRAFVCEGEKAADAAAGCGLVCVTSAHGAKSADKTEWGPLDGAGEVVLLPDHDEAGEGYAETVSRILAKLHPAPVVRVVKLADLAGGGFPKGGDFVDFAGEFRDGQDAEAIRAEVEAAADGAPVLVVKAEPVGTEGQDGAAAIIAPKPIPYTQLMAENPQRGPAIIGDDERGLLRGGMVGTVVSATKARKSWLVGALAVAGVSGGEWLGYPVARGRVLLIDGELKLSTIHFRFGKIFAAMGIDPKLVGDGLEVVSLRGNTKACRVALADAVARGPGYYTIIVLDPLYCFYPPNDPNFNENDNAKMRRLYDELIRDAEATGAALVTIHHMSKGSQGDKALIDLGSGAGAISRAGDAHLALLAHEEKGCFVFDGVVRDFPDVTATCWRYEHPLFRPAPDLDPAKVKGRKPTRQDRNFPASMKTKPVPPTVEEFVKRYLSAEGQTLAAIEVQAQAGKLSLRKIGGYLSAAVTKGLAHKWPEEYHKPARFATVAQPLISVGKPIKSKEKKRK